MRWSYSSARTFRQCQRKWYYAYVMAGPGRLKDETRLRARRLKGLSTISSWRGDIVDKTISDYVIPRLQVGDRVTLGEAKSYAQDLFAKQREFAEANTKEDLTLVKSHLGDRFALFYEHVYGPPLQEEDFEQAWMDIVRALSALYTLDEFRAKLSKASTYLAQPPLNFDIVGDLKGKARPDLLVYYEDGSIEIVDWKVHHDGTNDARGQLASYAIALSRMSKRNSNFPDENWQAPASEIIIKEAQLLLGEIREHVLTPPDIDDAEFDMMQSAFSMSQMIGDKKFEDHDILEFETTTNPELCRSCSFKLLCIDGDTHA